MVVLGLGYTAHEASAALVVDGRLATAIARERLTRIKRDGLLWGSARHDLDVVARYCLDANRVTFADVDLVVWNHIDHRDRASLTAMLLSERSQLFPGRRFLVLPHHFAHASYAFYLSPFAEAAILVADGSGGPIGAIATTCDGPEAEALAHGTVLVQDVRRDAAAPAHELESFYLQRGGVWKPLRKIVGEHADAGIGGRYGHVSGLLFREVLDAGKTMGLAPYGSPARGLRLLLAGGSADAPVFAANRGREWTDVEAQARAWRGAGSAPDYFARTATSLAATLQHDTETALVAHARWLRAATGASNLCLSGGVALNCVANSRIARESGFDRVFVPPAPGDDGIAAGCALYGAAVLGELSHPMPQPHFLGRSHSHSSDEITGLGLGLTALRDVPPTRVAAWIAQRIAHGAVVAWYEGGAELGPRALGHRSFFADPRDPNLRDHLNAVVKQREAFRPFAPVVLEEAVADFFEEHHPSHYMSFVAPVRAEWRARLPAITHVDGTARYQVLRPADHPRLDALLRAFAAITGVPMLLNTSLNRAGEPIVETPVEAARCAAASSADVLVIDGCIYQVGARA